MSETVDKWVVCADGARLEEHSSRENALLAIGGMEIWDLAKGEYVRGRYSILHGGESEIVTYHALELAGEMIRKSEEA